MTIETLYEYGDDVPAADYVEVPAWIDQDIDCSTVAAILQGGCESGAYMPAVTYHSALDTMRDHGDDVFDYIDDNAGLDNGFADPAGYLTDSWSGLAVHYLSTAVELWAQSVEDDLTDALESEPDDD